METLELALMQIHIFIILSKNIRIHLEGQDVVKISSVYGLSEFEIGEYNEKGTALYVDKQKALEFHGGLGLSFSEEMSRLTVHKTEGKTDITKEYSQDNKKSIDAIKKVDDVERRLLDDIAMDEILALALNMGNTGNLERLKNFTMIDSDGQLVQVDMRVINECVSHLKSNDWAFVQDVWDYLESLCAEIAALERTVNGKILKEGDFKRRRDGKRI